MRVREVIAVGLLGSKTLRRVERGGDALKAPGRIARLAALDAMTITR